MSVKDINLDGVGVANGTYFGLPFNTDSARLVLISAPWDVTVSYGTGASYAPDAIIEASTQLDFHDELSPDQWRKGIATADVDYSIHELSQRLRVDAKRVIEHLESGGNVDDDYVVRKIRRVNEGCAEMNRNIREQAAYWLDADKIVGLVGGDHSTPYGFVCALGARHESFGVLHIDAHCDLRDAYEGFEFSHASVMFNILRDVPQVEKIVQVGVRDYCDAEAKLARDSKRVELFSDFSLAKAEFEGQTWATQCDVIVAALPDKVYVSFDIDGLTIENCPHTGTPVSGGLTVNKTLYLIDKIVDSGRTIIGFDIVEVVPSADEMIDAMVGARVLWKLCGLTLRSNR